MSLRICDGIGSLGVFMQSFVLRSEELPFGEAMGDEEQTKDQLLVWKKSL